MNEEYITRTWKLNGEEITLEFPPFNSLLDVLREQLRLTGTKEGCREGECGACTVLLNGQAVVSCLVCAGQVLDGDEILTVEGLGKTKIGRTLQQNFIDLGATQCGFCIPGILMSAYSFLSDTPVPDKYLIRQALAGNICRCTGYKKIIEAVQQTAEQI